MIFVQNLTKDLIEKLMKGQYKLYIPETITVKLKDENRIWVLQKDGVMFDFGEFIIIFCKKEGEED